MLRVLTSTAGFSGGPWINLLHFTGLDTQTGADDATAKVLAFWNAVDTYVSTSATMTVDAVVDVLDPTDGSLTGQFNVTGDDVPGLASGDVLPPSAQLLCQLRTGVFAAGREVRGRINIGGMVEANSTLGRPASAMDTAVQAALDDLAAVTNPRLCVWSRARGTASAVASTDIATYWAVQRRRRDT